METFSVGNNDGKESFDSSSFFSCHQKAAKWRQKARQKVFFTLIFLSSQKNRKSPNFLRPSMVWRIEEQHPVCSFFSGNVCNE